MVQWLGLQGGALRVASIDRAVVFYTWRLGLVLASRTVDPPSAVLTLPEGRGGRLVLEEGPPRPGDDAQGTVVITVDDARDVAGRLTTLPEGTAGEPYLGPGGWAVTVTDPWGNHVVFRDGQGTRGEWSRF